ncbi:hypothetical protein P1X14_16170 [Sphingomonas sp. AOB5]|uniref:hypothetical protein n=1 Tax=Sphingomonas sp. AOB5 TaxID=3034017 RepID=UPI0023F67AA1|nr:hypothetical protein [Sphingomonas sp. AOB5]MDF7776793.1 hypothetical protein [Sphingomonas sp. AOB5]
MRKLKLPSGIKMPGWGQMTEAEYRANLNGLGIFFGAVLGFVMAGTETLGVRDFAFTLFFTATLVISILYVNSSRSRISYTLMTAGLIAALPFVLETVLSPGAQIPPRLQPTLAVWLGIAIVVELMPRAKEDQGAQDNQPLR